MLPTATIVFREILEIALVLTIVLAATNGLSGRAKLVLSGLGIGVLGSVIIAFFTDAISNAVHGVGQEIFNATIIFIAVGFLSWTVVWMRRFGREMGQSIQQVGRDVAQGKRPLYILVGVIAFATFREGTEIVLFTYGMTSSGAFALSSIVAGGVIGLVGGTLVGALLYFGLLKTARKHLFSVTSWMLIILTAGMAAKGTGYLVAADIVPALHPMVWDSSAFLSGHSLTGETLGVLLGYNPRPTGIELAVYAAFVLLLSVFYLRAGRAASHHSKAVPQAA